MNRSSNSHQDELRRFTSCGSTGSLGSKTSRCSTTSASPSIVAQHDAKLTEAFNRGDVEFLVNLLGAPDALCGFIKLKKMEYVKPFITGDGVPVVSRNQVLEVSTTNWPGQVTDILKMYDTVEVRHKLNPYFEKRLIGSDELSQMHEICGGQAVSVGDKGTVFLFAECCRREDAEFAVAVAQKYTRTTVMLDVLHARSTSSTKYYLTNTEKKTVSRFCKTVVKTDGTVQLKKAWTKEQEKEDQSTECCTIL